MASNNGIEVQTNEQEQKIRTSPRLRTFCRIIAQKFRIRSWNDTSVTLYITWEILARVLMAPCVTRFRWDLIFLQGLGVQTDNYHWLSNHRRSASCQGGGNDGIVSRIRRANGTPQAANATPCICPGTKRVSIGIFPYARLKTVSMSWWEYVDK
jgi:hypothetical protein